MQTPTRPLLLLALLTACSHDDGPDRAMRAFTTFQQALQQGDAPACRALLTRESQPVVAELPWEDLAARAPLTVLGAARARGRNPWKPAHIKMKGLGQPGWAPKLGGTGCPALGTSHRTINGCFHYKIAFAHGAPHSGMEAHPHSRHE